MTFLAIVAWTNDFRIAKYQDYTTEIEATNHVARVLARFPGAFVTPDPGGGYESWLIDPAGKKVTNSPLPPPIVPPAPLTAEELYDMLEAKGIVVEGDRPRPKLAEA